MKEEITTTGIIESLKRLCESLYNLVRHTNTSVSYKEETLITMPTLVAFILVILCRHLLIPAILISLIIGVKYTFTGREK